MNIISCYNSIKACQYVDRYNQSEWYTLFACYEKPSTRKREAFDRIKNRCEMEGGKDLKVLSAGCYFFTTAYIVPVEGEKYLLVVDTLTRTMKIPCIKFGKIV